MPNSVTPSFANVRPLELLMISLEAEAAEAWNVPFWIVNVPPKFGVETGVRISPDNTVPTPIVEPFRLAKVKVAAAVLVPEVISRTYHCPAAGKLVLVTDCPATSPLSAVVEAAVMIGSAVVPVLTAEVVIAVVAPLASPNEAESAGVDATRLLLMMKVELSRIAVMVEPNGIPAPEIGWPTTKSEVEPLDRVRVPVAEVPVAARLRVATEP